MHVGKQRGSNCNCTDHSLAVHAVPLMTAVSIGAQIHQLLRLVQQIQHSQACSSENIVEEIYQKLRFLTQQTNKLE